MHNKSHRFLDNMSNINLIELKKFSNLQDIGTE